MEFVRSGGGGGIAGGKKRPGQSDNGNSNDEPLWLLPMPSAAFTVYHFYTLFSHLLFTTAP